MALMFVPEWALNWLTPVWLLGVGALFGLIALLVLWAVVWCISRLTPAQSRFRREVDEIPIALRYEVLFPISIVVLVFAFFGIFGVLFAHTPVAILGSLLRITAVGESDLRFDVPPTPRDEDGDVDPTQEYTANVNLRADEVRQFRIRSDKDVTLSLQKAKDIAESRPEFRVSAGEEYVWKRGEESLAGQGNKATIDQLYVVNQSNEAANVTLTVWTAPAHPEVLSVLWAVGSIVSVYVLYLLQRALAPKLTAIALATYKSAIAQPLFPIIICIGTFVLLIFVIVPYNTLGEDIKVLKDTGFTLIMVLSLFQAIWAASTSVAEEIEGRTALTVLSKPIRRHSFVLGKYVGICWTVALIFIILGAVFMVCVAYKPLYDARESSAQGTTWQLCHYEMVMTVPGLVLSFMQTLVLSAISVAISTRLSLMANFILSFSVYVLGNITPVLVEKSGGQFPIVHFFAQLIATVLPNLESFNIQAAIAADAQVPLIYLASSLLYCVLYSAIAMLLALLLFEDRDLA
jgi:ABC-type transport system involved in multi-copper enzyme maturation permease subunit